eukprot:4616799-Prorocentrum_lima.AAC.1
MFLEAGVEHYVGRCHPSHQLRAASKVIWCASCGLYGWKQIKKLQLPCSGVATHGCVLFLKRLLSGISPVK